MRFGRPSALTRTVVLGSQSSRRLLSSLAEAALLTLAGWLATIPVLGVFAIVDHLLRLGPQDFWMVLGPILLVIFEPFTSLFGTPVFYLPFAIFLVAHTIRSRRHARHTVPQPHPERWRSSVALIALGAFAFTWPFGLLLRETPWVRVSWFSLPWIVVPVFCIAVGTLSPLLEHAQARARARTAEAEAGTPTGGSRRAR